VKEEPTSDVFHRVQRTGGASLTVTLPKSWLESMHVSNGDMVRLRNLGAGRLEITPANPGSRRAVEKMFPVQIHDSPPNLLARLLVGAYVTGHDLIRLTAETEFTDAQREEIRRSVVRMLGINVVEERRNLVEIQVFVDPARHSLPHLRERVVRLLRAEIALCRSVLGGTVPQGFRELSRMEEEIDRIYLLMVRQLLLASDDFRVAQEIGVPSHHFQIGERLVSKILEMIGDLLYDTGRELFDTRTGLRGLSVAGRADIDRLFERFDALLGRTMDAFAHFSVEETNATLNELLEELDRKPAFSRLLSRRYPDVPTGMLVQRVVSNLLTCWEMLVAVNEVALNRAVEPERTGDLRPDRPLVLGSSPTLTVG
jgi:phosphate uptake regulator